MKNNRKTKNELIAELESVCRKVKKLETLLKKIKRTEQDITERKRMEESLGTERRFLRQVIDTVPAFICVKTESGPYALANESLAKAYGTTVSGVEGKSDLDFSPTPEEAAAFRKDDLEVIHSRRTKTIAEEPITYEDGTVHWYSTTKIPVIDPDDSCSKVLVIAMDITELHEHREHLRELVEQRTAELTTSQAALVEAQAVAHMGSWEYDAIGDGIKGSEEFYRLFDVAPKDLARFSQFVERLHPDDRERVQRDVADALQQDRPYETDYRVKLGDNSWRNINARGRVFTDAAGKTVSMIGTCLDITKRKQVEEALRDSEERYRTTMMSVGDGVITTDTEGRIELLNPVTEALTGWRQEEARGKPLEEIFRIVNEETLQIVENPVRQVMREGVVVGLANHSVLIAKDGTEHPIADSGAPIRNEKGEITGVVLVFRDQTEERRAQKALRESKENYRNLYENAPVGIYRTRIDGSKILEINNTACRILGFTKEELMNQPSAIRWADGNRRNEIVTILKEYGVANNFGADVLMKDGSKISCLLSMNLNRTAGYLEGFITDITERKRAEEALHESEVKYRELFENAQVGMYRSKLDGTAILAVNRKLCEIFGYTEKEMFDNPATIRWADPSARARMVENLRKSGFLHDYEIDILTKSAEIRNLSISVYLYPEKGYLEGSAVDITERKRMEEELLKLNAQLEQRVLTRTQELQVANEELNATNDGLQVAQKELQRHREEQQIILDSVPAWIFYKDRENRFIRVNQAFADVMGMTKEQLDGKALIDLFPKAQADAYGNDDKKVIESGQPERNIIESMDSPEGTLWVQTDKLPYRDIQGNIIGIIGFTVDITERKKLEDSLRDQAVKTEALNKELESFAYSVSHDLRAPLRHISGYVELLTSRFHSALSEKGQHYLESISDSAHQMGSLIDNLLQFSRTGRAEMHQSELEMNGIVEGVVESVRKDNPDRAIEWVVGALPAVFGDDATMRLVWINLLSNAVKFTRTRQKAFIEIGARVETKEVIFFVRDNGVGFDMQYAQKLFGVFQRLHSTAEFEGTGIGLANVHRIVMRHGGRTWAEAELDKGATFYFSIPKQ